MQIGIDSFVINTPDPVTNNGISTEDRMSNLLSVAGLEHDRALRSIELIGSQVMPRVNAAKRAA